MRQRDQELLRQFNLDLKEFKRTTDAIENDVRLRPYDFKQPTWRWISIRILSILCLLLYIYIALLVLQMSLFNLILVGISIVYLNKVWTLCSAIELKIDQAYRTGPLNRFIQQENRRYYDSINVVLIAGGVMGECLEL
jgi:hypothetical protein